MGAPSRAFPLDPDRRQEAKGAAATFPPVAWVGGGGGWTDSSDGRPGQSISEPERNLPRFLKRTVEERPKPVVLTAFSRAGAERGEDCACKDASVAGSPFVCLLPRAAAGVTSERSERSEGGGSFFFRRHTLSKTLSTTGGGGSSAGGGRTRPPSSGVCRDPAGSERRKFSERRRGVGRRTVASPAKKKGAFLSRLGCL